jgi:membrane protein YdbS with pleckstrin-like domain
VIVLAILSAFQKVIVVSIAVVLLLSISCCKCLFVVVYANSVIVVTVVIVSAVPVAILYGIVCCAYFKYLFGISEQRTKPQGLGFCGTMAHHKNKQQKKV